MGSSTQSRSRLGLLAALTTLALVATASGQPRIGAYAPGELDSALSDVERASEAHARVEAEVEALVAQQSATGRRVRTRVRALYRLSRAGALPLAGGFEALLRHQSRVQRLERMVSRDIENSRALSRRVAALGAESGRLAEAVEEAERRARSARERADQEQNSLAAIAALMADPSGSAGAASVTEAGTWSGPPPTANFGLRVPGAPGPGPEFLSRRGHLSLPVGGSARVADGEREGGRGLELTAAPGVTVRAVAPGRVAYASRHPAYERLVILDHGGTFYTVYGGLSSLAVSPGAEVAADSPLGAVGGRPLFFQVRRGSRPLDTRSWLGI